MGSKKQEDSFEALYKSLEDTVSRLEQGDLTLEESLTLYEQGMKLARRCQELLHRAELKITKLQESFAEDLAAPEEEPEPEIEGFEEPYELPAE